VQAVLHQQPQQPPPPPPPPRQQQPWKNKKTPRLFLKMSRTLLVKIWKKTSWKKRMQQALLRRLQIQEAQGQQVHQQYQISRYLLHDLIRHYVLPWRSPLFSALACHTCSLIQRHLNAQQPIEHPI